VLDIWEWSGKVKLAELPVDQPPAVTFTAFADAWPRAIESEIGAALCAIGRGKGLWPWLLTLIWERYATRIGSWIPKIDLTRGQILNKSLCLKFCPLVKSIFGIHIEIGGLEWAVYCVTFVLCVIHMHSKDSTNNLAIDVCKKGLAVRRLYTAPLCLLLDCREAIEYREQVVFT